MSKKSTTLLGYDIDLRRFSYFDWAVVLLTVWWMPPFAIGWAIVKAAEPVENNDD